MRALLDPFIKATSTHKLDDALKLQAKVQTVASSRVGQDSERHPLLAKLIAASTALHKEIKEAEDLQWKKMEAASNALAQAVAAAEESRELQPLQEAMAHALANGVGKKSQVHQKAAVLESVLQEYSQVLEELQDRIAKGRERFGFDYDDPDDHEYAEIELADVPTFKAMAKELGEFANSKRTRLVLAGKGTGNTQEPQSVLGDEGDELQLSPEVQRQLAEAKKVAGMLLTRSSIAHLRLLVDEADLESSTPYEEKTVTAKQIEDAIFLALDHGLDEESELYEAAGQLAENLSEEAELYEQEKLEGSFDDSDTDEPELSVKVDDKNAGYQQVRKLQRRNSIVKSQADVASSWLRIQTTATSHYYYNAETGQSENELPSEPDDLHEVVQKPAPLVELRQKVPFLYSVILLQKVIRGFISKRRIERDKCEHNLRVAIDEVRKTRDVNRLLEAIHTALDEGIDDESDVYFEAGELMEALDDADTVSAVEKRGGMEWTKMWDPAHSTYYYLNVATNETRSTPPDQYDSNLDLGVESLPRRVRLLLSLQTTLRRVARRWRLASQTSPRP